MPSHSPTSHIPSASLGNNHTPHTEETQSTDSGFLDTPVASKNSQAMTKQIGIWSAHNSSTSLLGSARASPCWALPPLPSPVSETVSCCRTPQAKCELEGRLEPPPWVPPRAGVACSCVPSAWSAPHAHRRPTPSRPLQLCVCVCAPQDPPKQPTPPLFVTRRGCPGSPTQVPLSVGDRLLPTRPLTVT